MRLDDVDESGSVEDRRGNKKAVMAGGGIVAVIIALVAGYFGIDPNVAKNLANGLQNGAAKEQPGKPPEDGYKEFSEKILGSTNSIWRDLFSKNIGREYKAPSMVLFSDSVDSEGCGVAPSSVGPFYCPVSRKVFLDPSFFQDLESKLGGSKAQFSQAYVIAHEVGHHVQNLLKYNDQVEEFKRKEGENSGIRLELQADYLAGVWAHHAQKKFHILDSESEVQEALKTARAIGDNRIQEKMRGKSWPESFNHGRDDQRYKYFKQGFTTGDASLEALDHFFDPRIKPLDL